MTPPATAAATAPRTRPGVAPRPRITPPRPRRVSGPARGPARARPLAPAPEQGLALGVAGLAKHVSGHRALDRLITSRLWIGLIAFALIGIVALQLLVLRMSSSIGESLVREASLQRENAALSVEGSELASGERVEAHAAHLGMQLVPIGLLLFLTSDPRRDLERAAAALNTPVHGAGATSQTGSTATGTTSSAASASTSTSTASSTAIAGEQPAGSDASATGSDEAATGSDEAATGASAQAGATSTAGAPGSAPAVSAQSSAGTATPTATPTTEGAATPAGTGITASTPASASTPVGAGGGVGVGQTSGSG
jgi:hypothetical protein